MNDNNPPSNLPPVLIYIHGFLSSPESVKATLTLDYIAQHHPELTVVAPQVPHYPQDAVALLEDIVTQYAKRPLRFIGSSMGGYLSTYLVEKFGGKAVLINPAVKPFELLTDYLGDHIHPNTKEHFTLTQQHIEHLQQIDTPTLKVANAYWALLQTGDETLDYRQAEQKYQNSKLTIEQGGDHSFQNYQRHLPEIMRFLLNSSSL
ncbi:YqiA/YcfP family alpha/beta fold hydrolase [Aliiglaciecola litoralis]|uniref:Esterase YqiA n=1 Tax=Aliiglaciecola litoralis TaxID=582857 RepID=A0ABN1LEH7_9ALTE